MTVRSSSEPTSTRSNSLSIVLAMGLVLGLQVTGPALAGPFAFTANRGSNDVTVADAWTHRVVATLPTSALPTDLVASPDGGTLYVATDRHLSVVDLRTLDRRDIPYSPGLNDATSMAMHPNGRVVFVSHGGANFLTRIDLPSGVVSAIGLPVFNVRQIAISETGDWVFGVTGLGDVVQLETATGLSATLFSAAFSFPTGISTNDRDEVFVASDGNLSVEMFEVTAFGTARPSQVIASGFRPGGLSGPQIGGSPLVTQPFDGEVLDTTFGGTVSIGPFAGPFDVAVHDGSPYDATANLGDVTGQAPAGAGSMSFITSSSVSASVPAGVTPVAVTIAAERGREVMGPPDTTRFPYLGQGSTVRRTIDVVSVGDDNAFVWDVTVVGPDAAAFRIVTNGCRHRDLPYQRSCSVVVEFTAIPKTLPWYAGYLQVYVPTYDAQLAIDIADETPTLVKMRAAAWIAELKAEVKAEATRVRTVNLGF